MVQESGLGSACNLIESLSQLLQISPICLSISLILLSFAESFLMEYQTDGLSEFTERCKQFRCRNGKDPGLNVGLSLPHCVTLSKSFFLSETRFLHL